MVIIYRSKTWNVLLQLSVLLEQSMQTATKLSLCAEFSKQTRKGEFLLAVLTLYWQESEIL